MKQKQRKQLNQQKNHTFFSLRSLDFSQTILFVQTCQVGAGLFNLPRLVSEKAGHSGWIAILIAGMIIQVAVIFIVKLLHRFGNLDVYQIMNKLFGRWLGSTLGAVFALYFVFVAAVVTRSYIEVVQQWLFPTTSTLMFYILLIMPTVYCALGGARVLGQFAVVTFFGTIWMMALLVVPIQDLQTDYYRPLFHVKLISLLQATWEVGISAVGFELLLVIYPFLQYKKKALLASSIGTWMTTAIYLIVVLIAIGFYSQEQIKSMLSPTLHLFKIVMLPIIERIEHIGIVTWSFLIVNTAASYIWAASRYLAHFNKWRPTTCVLVLAPIVYGIGIYPRNLMDLTTMQELAGMIGALVSVGLPPLLLLIALIFHKKADEQPPSDTPKQEVQAS
ncbi:spore germination protein (amino acid permease) [Tumebacillus sp. BK434]|uniref:GerAB/ArcD/ProY family transporter n=1 Tax=Tumebacillus sp. BK434 TaxID=2512169 RepID=UPI0010D9828E|nr:GerAB/ArcD/ProY family transporter [Tumebacillus sp. BK434]TCP57709.1 spore germination protein (amino acid permease) [Tumebacillus sp. BK434]